jgi:hypothetical protein
MPKICPSCGTRVDEEGLHCPNCPYSFPETHASVDVGLRWSPIPALLLAALAFALGASWWIFFRSANARRRDSIPFASAKRALEDGPVAEPGAQAEEQPVYIPGQTPMKSPPEVRVKEWRVRGAVYDLLTFKPLAGARVVLSDPYSDDRFETETGADGRYRTIVPPLAGRGYSVFITREGYLSTYLDSRTRGVRKWPRSKRRSSCRRLRADFSEQFTVRPAGPQPLVTDFYLPSVSCR